MKVTAQQKEHLLKWVIAATIYFFCLIAFYSDIGEDMGAQYFMPILVPTIAALTLVQYGSRVPIFSKEALPNLLTGVGWCITFPLLYAWTYQSVWYPSLICFDFIVGTAGFVILMALDGVCCRLGHVKITSAILAVLNFIGLAIPFIQFSYYIMVWHCLSPASVMAIYLTNYQESIDFIQSNVGLVPTILILIGFAIFLYACWRGHMAFAKRSLKEDTTAGRMGTLAAMAILPLLVEAYYVPQTSVAEILNDVTSYVEQTQQYSRGHDDRLHSLVLNQQQALPAKAPGTVIVVIGESASRNYMKAYTPNYQYDDTPWLDQQFANPDSGFIKFSNVYSSWSQTVPVLQRALTEQSQYNDKEFFDSASIVDVAKKAGYETWWFSNQGRYGQYDSAITLVAKTADHAQWTDDSYTFTDKYDESLLPYLTQLDPTKNNFVVIHIMGSHIYYNNRYPKSFEQFKTDDSESTALSMASYANSILYTDYILSQIFNYAQKNLNLQAMVYFSDHGENIEISHNPDVFTFDMVRIPMFVYLSPTYRDALPGRTETLLAHENSYFTNDMLYNTISGLLNAPSTRYDPTEDFTSPNYRFTRDTLTTMLGQHKLTEDLTDDPAAQANNQPESATPQQTSLQP